MTLQGFNYDNPNPMYVTLTGPLTELYGSDPIEIAPNLATWSGVGLLVDIPSATPETVGAVRHWVNASQILEIVQKQPDPIQYPDS